MLPASPNDENVAYVVSGDASSGLISGKVTGTSSSFFAIALYSLANAHAPD